jgi:hypothetical protein
LKEFIEKHRLGVSGVLSGWDRLVIRGSDRMLCATGGMMAYWSRVSVLLKNFGTHAEAMTKPLMEASLGAAERLGRPVVYLPSAATRKEDVAQRVLREQPVKQGLICVLKSVEPCMSFEIHRHRAAKKLALQSKQRKCLHRYHYFLDPLFGFKPAANGNSVKMYDKGPNLLRVETTINNAGDLKVYRTAEGDPHGKPPWRPMRKGIADLHRRAQLSRKTNERYLNALAQLESSTRLEDILAPVSRRVKRRGRAARPLRVWTAEDQALLESIERPEFLLGGFRNRDLARLLYPDENDSLSAKRRVAARVSYRLGILRAHGLIAKLPNTRRYRITVPGQRVAAAIISQKLTLDQLTQAAA